MKSRANFLWGRSLVVKCDQGIMAASVGGCDLCVCVWTKVRAPIGDHLYYWYCHWGPEFRVCVMVLCQNVSLSLTKRSEIDIYNDFFPQFGYKWCSHIILTFKLISCINEILSLIYALSEKKIPWSIGRVSVTTNPMKQSPSWAADSSSASQIPRSLSNPKVHYHIHKCPAPVPNPEPQQSSPLSISHYFKIHFNIILPSTPWSSKRYIFVGFSHQNPLCTSPAPCMCHMPLLSLTSWFDHTNNIWCRVKIIKLLVM